MHIENICCIGAGYVGGPTMAVIALKCPEIKITVVDSNKDRIDSWNGELEKLPVYEPGLKEIISVVRNKNLFFSKDIDQAINNSEMIFIAVNTPTKTKGEGAGMAADLKFVENCAINIARVANKNKIVVEKSTLPVRTAEKLKEILCKNSKGIHFEVLSNPEFLAEGTAIEDLFKSDRVLVGGDQTKKGKEAIQTLVNIYSKWIPREKILTTNVWSSELSKLASNAMLAQRISSINSFSALCEKTGADITELSKAIGMDHRIGPKFLNTSVGFGGSCFQKDILNLVYLSKKYGLIEVAEYWNQVIKINDFQKARFAQKIISLVSSNVNQSKISLLGWAFKPNTNDSRESPAIYIADYLIRFGLNIKVYDPKIKKDRIYRDLDNLWKLRNYDNNKIKNMLIQIDVSKKIDECVDGVDVIAIITKWNEFEKLEWKNKIKESIVLDGTKTINLN